LAGTEAIGNTTSNSDRPGGHPQLGRDRILEMTSVCFREQGYEATTIRRIAGLLGCAVGSIYRYFTDKRELLAAMSEQMLQDVVTRLETGASIEQSLRTYARQARTAPRMYRLMFWLASVQSPDRQITPTPQNQANDLGAVKLPQVVMLIILGWGRRLGDERLAGRCWAMLHGSLLLELPEAESVAAVLELLEARPNRAAPLFTTRPGARIPVSPAPVRPVQSAAQVDPAQGHATDDGAARSALQPQGGPVARPVYPAVPPSAKSATEGGTEDVCLL